MTDDYTRVLVSFYEKNIEKQFTSCERDLFLYLLCVWARSKQVTPFLCSTSQTERDLSMPRKTIMQCRRRLCERGLISFQEGRGKGNNPYYYFSEVTEKVTVKVTEKVTVTKEEISPTPPKEENNIYNNKETSSSEDVKKASLPSTARKKKEEVRIDYSSLANYFNDLLSPWLPKIQKIDGQRRVAVDARVKEHGKEKIVEALNLVSKSDFLTGRKEGSDWKCNFDWIFKKSNFQKILEGNYNNGASDKQVGGQRNIDPDAAREQLVTIYREVYGYDGPPEKFEEWYNRKPFGS